MEPVLMDTVANALEAFFAFPWQGVAGFVATIVGLFVLAPQLPKKFDGVRLYVQARFQSLIGVGDLVHAAITKVETNVQERHVETMGELSEIKADVKRINGSVGRNTEAIANHLADHESGDPRP